MIASREYQNILNFSCDLNKNFLKFYEATLKLIEKYFNYKYIIFVPEIINTKSIKEINNIYCTNFYSLNIPEEFIFDFKKYYYKQSIFKPSNLTKELRTKQLLLIDDIIPYEEFTHTENYNFLTKYNFHYILCINLISNNVGIGSICILKTKLDGNFTKHELEIAEIIGNILSIQYDNFLKLSNSLLKESILKKSFNMSNHGLIIWNNSENILEANSVAEEFSLELSKSLPTDNFYYSHLVSDNENNEDKKHIKTLTNYLTIHNFHNTNNKTLSIPTATHVFNIDTSIVTLPEIAGNLRTFYLARISKTTNTPNCPFNDLKLIYNLTDRELEIFSLIKKGYSNSEISKQLFLSLNTVKTHISNIFKKLDVNNRSSLINKLSLTSINEKFV